MYELELCDHCRSEKVYQYDFNKRCCRARHTAQYSRTIRQGKYQRMLEKYGQEYTEQHISDVNAYRRFKAGNKIPETDT